MNRTLWSLISVLGAVAGLPACSSKSCSTQGCAATVTAQLALPSSLPAGAQVTACRLTDCATATLPAVGGSNQGMAVTFSNQTNLSGILQNNGGSLRLDIQWYAVTSPVNGDRYTVTVTDSSGATLAALEKAATYGSYWPNGTDCDPVCQVATLIDVV